MASTALDQFRTTAVAFDDLIVSVGTAIAAAQDEMDRAGLELQRQAIREVRSAGGALELPGVTCYAIPETKLSLRVGLSMRSPDGEGAPVLQAVPINAASSAEGGVELSATSAIELRFVSVPRSDSPPGPPTGRLRSSEVLELLGGPWTSERSGASALLVDELVSERLWLAMELVASEPVRLAVVDDRRGEIISSIFDDHRPDAAALEVVGAPWLERVLPAEGRAGQILEVQGDNLLTLAGQTTLRLDGLPVPILRLGMRALAFKIPAWSTRGDLEVTTPLGSATLERAFRPLPTIDGFDPPRGCFDSLLQKGTWITIEGRNLRPGCSVRFANDVLAKRVTFVSETRMQVEVPSGAASGPLRLELEGHVDATKRSFRVLPKVDRVQPRQATVGAVLTLTGNAFDAVQEIGVGRATIRAEDFELHTSTRIQLRVPPGATDGPLSVRIPGEGAGELDLVQTRDRFYVVPKITGFSPSTVIPGQLLMVRGEGLDPRPDMMTLLFEARGGLGEAPVLSVSDDRRSLTTRVPSDAVCGRLLLVRKNIYSGQSPDDTSSTSEGRLTVLTADGSPRDVLLDERFSNAGLPGWSVESGAWSIIAGQLACRGIGRLSHTLPEGHRTLVVHAEILAAACFGLSLRKEGSDELLQLWIRFAEAGSTLTWSTLHPNGRQALVGSAVLPQRPGGSHLLSLWAAPSGIDSLDLRVALDQQQVHRQVVQSQWISAVALLSDETEQRWDNVVMLGRDALALPEPGDHRFAPVPTDESSLLPVVTGFEPRGGAVGSQVAVLGEHLEGVIRVMLGGVEAVIEEARGDRVILRVPEGAVSGTLEIHARSEVVVASHERFQVHPVLTGSFPMRTAPGARMYLFGRNLPTEPAAFEVMVLGQAAEVLSASASAIVVRVPDVEGSGLIEVVDTTTARSQSLFVEVERAHTVLDLVADAAQAEWRTLEGRRELGAPVGPGGGSVRLGDGVSSVDGEEAGSVLVLEPPPSSTDELDGELGLVDVEVGDRLEVRFGAQGRLVGEIQLAVYLRTGNEVRALLPPTLVDPTGEVSTAFTLVDASMSRASMVVTARRTAAGSGVVVLSACRIWRG